GASSAKPAATPPDSRQSPKPSSPWRLTTEQAPCPAKALCTSATRWGRQLTLRPRPLQELIDANHTAQENQDWQAKYALRAGVEGTIRQAMAVTGTRRARYRGLAKTRLEHVFSAVALNLIRLDAWWNGQPLDHTRTSHLARLDLTLAA
ncbi:transposase, partial [Streptomyces sp. NPDC127051]|uniref:transposase n=1 Tax=Streptomyces sp. NPDC127051 TaxID=3347119 RepID=UPI003666E62E